jgi:hypothetical protein
MLVALWSSLSVLMFSWFNPLDPNGEKAAKAASKGSRHKWLKEEGR